MVRIFEPKKRLTEKETEKSLSSLLRDGIFSQAMISLAGGSILIAFALGLGADKTFVGLIVSLSFFAGLIQIPSIYLVEKMPRRKLIVLTSSILSRMFILLLAAIPLLAIQNSLWFLFVFLALHYALANISAAAWNPWMRDLVPMKIRGEFFAKRMERSLVLALVLSIGGGLFLDYWGVVRGDLLGFSLVFALAFLFGMVSDYYDAVNLRISST